MTDTTAPRTAARWSLDELSTILVLHFGHGPIGRYLVPPAIEPLLALVRAAQDAADRRYGQLRLADPTLAELRAALAALPESVRVAAREAK